MIRVHRRQFIIDKRPHAVYPDWRTLPLSSGYVLSHCPDLEVHACVDKAGRDYVVVGQSVSALPEETAHRSTDFERDSRYWSGRWLLIAGDRIRGDASNYLGVFYAKNDDRSLFITSSLSLVHQLRPTAPYSHLRLSRYGMGWFPPPESRIEGVNKLLPDQYIDLAAADIRAAPTVRDDAAGPATVDDAARRLLAALRNVFSDLSTRYQDIFLALSGGLDSRTLLAAALAEGVALHVFSFEHPLISRADRELPQTMSAAFGLPYTFVPCGPCESDRQQLYDQHTFRDIHDGDRFYFPRGMFKIVPRDCVMLRGGFFEIGRRHYRDVFTGLNWSDIARAPETVVRRFHDFVRVTTKSRQLAAWIDWRSQHREPFDWIDLFYRDQRLAGWAAAGAQGMDLIDASVLHPANCQHVFDVLLSVDDEAKIGGDVQRRMIELSGTGLDHFAINPDWDSAFHHWHNRLQRGLRIIGRELPNVLLH